MNRALRPIVLLLVLTGCGVGSTDLTAPTTTAATEVAPQPAPLPPPSACPEVVETERLGRVQNADLTEISGLATSALNPGLLWAHNDSGGEAAVYAIGRDGADLGKYLLSGVTNRDWEDMARWTDPATGANWLYVGDIGDNVGQWESVFVHRLPEPVVEAAAADPAAIGVETFEFAYPDGPHNAETLLVDPTTGEITIVTKGDGATARVFTAPGAVPGAVVELTDSGTLDMSLSLAGLPTAGDYLGGFVLIRTYLAVLAYPLADGSWWEAEPCELDPPFEIQGEALAAEIDERGYLTVSEGRRVGINRSVVG